MVTEWKQGAFIAVDEDKIIDDMEESNLNILMEVICTQADKKQPLGDHHNSKPNLYDIVLKDVSGQPMDRDTKKRLLNTLVMEGVVKKETGSKRGNGLRPT